MTSPALDTETVVLRIDPARALLSRIGRDGAVSRLNVERELAPDDAFFARIVDALADHERLIVLGPATTRLAFEREYVEICHRPDRLVDVPA